MEDGFYTATYVGVAGMGVCIFLFENGRVRGFDMRGGKYDGNYTRAADGTIEVRAMLVVNAGIELVTGEPPQDKDFMVPVVVKLPAVVDESEALSVSVGDRQAQATFKRMRGL